MRKFVTLGITGLAVAGMAGLGTYSVSAMSAGNGQANGNGAQTALASKATAVNLTADQLREQLETKTMLQVAEDQGLTLEQYQAKVRDAAQSRWEDRGLSAEEIATRTAEQTERQADCDGTGTGAQQHAGYGRRSE
jgi:hypothetical protein